MSSSRACRLRNATPIRAESQSTTKETAKTKIWRSHRDSEYLLPSRRAYVSLELTARLAGLNCAGSNVRTAHRSEMRRPQLLRICVALLQ